MIYSKLPTWNVTNKRVLVRADLNIPLKNGKICNDFRLLSILPTLNYLINRSANIVLITHIGRPKNHEPELSTQQLIPWFAQRGYTIQFVNDANTLSQLKIIPKQILLIENLRFFEGEQTGDPLFAKRLATSSTYYVNDAFGVAHRNDCSVTLLPYEFTENHRTIGFLMEKELRIFDSLKNNPQNPFLAILGGGKIEDKIPLIQGLLKNINTILLCPAICFSFLKALKKPIGLSLANDKLISKCKQIIHETHNNHIFCRFPTDYQVFYDTSSDPLSVVAASEFPHNAIGISIGPKTTDNFISEINQAKTIFFNCAMGFENQPETRQNTYKLIKAMANSHAIMTVIAGGDSVEAAINSGAASSISHLSTGGGAALAYLGGKLLPCLAAFEEL